MVKVSDHVEQRDYVGHHGKRGVVVATKGELVIIRWEDGHESSFIPGPGALNVIEPKESAKS